MRLYLRLMSYSVCCYFIEIKIENIRLVFELPSY
jgi:hypothetical protein